MDAQEMLGLVAVFVLAGAVKGVTGMGLPTVAVSLLGLWMGPVQAAALLVTPSLATNIAQCRGPHGRTLATRLWPLWLGLAAATLLAPGLGGAAQGFDSRRWLGGALVVYGLWGLGRPRLPDLSGRAGWIGLPVGLATGLVTAMTAVFVMPMVPYLQTLRLEKDAMVQALSLSFTVATLSLAGRLGAAGQLALLSWPVALALVAAFAGLGLGAAARARLSGPAFQRALFVVFIGLGLANFFHGR